MTSASDILGPWEEPDWESSLVERCRNAWSKPFNELTNLELVTFLSQGIATDFILPVAQDRVSNNIDDDSERFDGELAETVQKFIEQGW